jgi:hypothetical protein
MSGPTRKVNESVAEIVTRVASLDWFQIGNDLDAYGCAVAEGVLVRDLRKSEYLQRRKMSVKRALQTLSRSSFPAIAWSARTAA